MQDNSTISDKTLVSSIRKGDHLAFDQMFQKYGPTLFSFVVSIIKEEAESEELVQDIFLKIWEKRKELQPELSFKSYLFTIALNAAKKYYRKKLLNDKYKQELAIELSRDTSHDLSVLEYQNLLDYVDSIINKLPAARREIFILSKKEGLKNSEIAQKLGISEQTVKNQLVTALKFLKAEAENDNNELGFLFFSLFIDL